MEVFEDKVAITPKGIAGFLNKSITGTKEIPFLSIVAVQFKEASVFWNGYIQFTIPGGNEIRRGIFAATEDENTFMFSGAENNALVIEIKEYIELATREARAAQVTASSSSLSDEIQKLAKLKEQGLLSEEEFQAAKKKVIG